MATPSQFPTVLSLQWLKELSIGKLAELTWRYVDRNVIDRGGVEGPGKLVLGVGTAARYSQVGFVSVATTATLLGAVAVLMWMVLHG